MNRRILRTATFVFLAAASSARASWLSEITGIDVNLNASTVQVKPPNLAAVPQMLQNLPKDVGQAFLNPAGTALAAAIRHAAAQARYGAQPIPDNIKEQLTPYFPQSILNKAVWNTFDGNRVTLDTQIMRACWDSIGAVTVDNVIVFKQSSNVDDVTLWAHELTHVMQYDNMGVETFAFTYTYSWNDLENPAYAMQARVQSDRQRLATGQVESIAPISYSLLAPIGSRPVMPQQLAAAVQQYYPARSCAQVQNVPGGAYVTNVCPTWIVVTGWTQMNAYYGPVGVPCVNGCGLAPGQTQPVWSTVGGPISSVGFAYAR
jgi:hypothetical protein